ncbi:YkgJ family cysteine cluster protein [Dyadobacter sp. CY261]|uniref:YkgJ family cysteine cluster protein n=1 Tax=Dyadobacter sp. CY261 TaxID=2907203 RepID=UPI001F2C38AD|nr:YkgJ family cysteine cluster protein [Dyadobacter sp. CY261]MCF0073223.1 YkgJ family cysteine cluster protein [Dyadobacter sp. CY261]
MDTFCHNTMSDSEKDVSDLCVSCGMCCDGTLFNTARIQDDKDRKLADSLDLITGGQEDKLYFKMPCPHFAGCCSIYDRNRPQICSMFFCNPLKKFQRGEQGFLEATQQVRSLQEHRDKFMKVASQFPEFDGLGFREIKNKLGDLSEQSDNISTYRHLFLLLFVFDDLKTRYFEAAKKEEVQ